MARDSGLLMLALWLALHDQAPVHARPTLPRPRMDRAGFSLVEMLIVVAVIGVIPAIVIPVLGEARKAAAASTRLSDQHQCTLAMSQNLQGGNDYVPYMGIAGKPERGALPALAWPDLAPSYFRGASTHRPTALLEHGIDLTPLELNSRDPSLPQVVVTYVWLTHSVAARSPYWLGADPPADAALFDGSRIGECVFPSAKGALCNIGRFKVESASWEVSMVDGSESRRSLNNPDLLVEGLTRRLGAVNWRALTTAEGLRGRDD